MKTFSELNAGDTVYFLIDTCNILQEHGNNSMGFANPNYGLILCQRIITSPSYAWRNPKKDTGTLFTLEIDKPIMKGDKCLLGKHINEYGREAESMMSITKEMGRQSCIQTSFGDYFCSYTGYMFTTKEELEKKVKEIIDVVETNLKRINDDLSNLY